MGAQRPRGSSAVGEGWRLGTRGDPRLADLLAPALWFSVLGGVVLGPLLQRGYLLLLDAPAGPRPLSRSLTPLPSEGLVAAGAPFGLVVRLADTVAPEATNKILVFLTIFLGGLGLYRFARHHLMLTRGSSLLGGTLFVLNPWIYDRLLAGQLWLTLAFALLPWALPALLQLITRTTVPHLVRTSAWCAGIGLIDLHVGGLALFLACVALIVSSSAPLRRVVYVVAVLALIAVLHAFWALPAALANEAARLAPADLEAFAPVPRSVQILPHVLLLHGFWRTEFETALSAQPLQFTLAFLPLVATALLGFNLALSFVTWRRAATGLGLACGVAIVLGMGTSFAPTAGLTRWLFTNVPGYGIYREPQKWIALLALGYSVFAAVGCEGIRGLLRTGRREPTYLIAVAGLPLIAVSVMLWGFGGRVALSSFPREWERGAELIDDKPGRLLFLPWNLYQPLPFADGRLIANPGDRFFPIPTLVSPDARIGGTQTADPRVDLISDLIRSHRRVRYLGHLIAPLGIRFVGLAKIGDAHRYRWVGRQADLRLIHEGRELVMWENNAWRGDTYALDGARGIARQANLAELLAGEGSQRLPASTLAPWKPSTKTGTLPGVAVSLKLPGWSRPATPESSHLGTSLSCLDGWRLGDSDAVCHMGAAAAFPVGTSDDALWRPGLGSQLLGYGLSIIAWGSVAGSIARFSRGGTKLRERHSQ